MPRQSACDANARLSLLLRYRETISAVSVEACVSRENLDFERDFRAGSLSSAPKQQTKILNIPRAPQMEMGT